MFRSIVLFSSGEPDTELKTEDLAMAPSSEITIPNVRLGLEELLAVIQRLDGPSRTRVAETLVEVEMDARLKHLIEQMAARAFGDDLTDTDIDREVQAVRDAVRSA